MTRISIAAISFVAGCLLMLSATAPSLIRQRAENRELSRLLLEQMEREAAVLFPLPR